MYSLSNPQKLIYEMEKYAGGAVAVICGSVLLGGRREEEELTFAVHEIFRRNDVLRTRIVERDGQVGQEIKGYQESSVNMLCFDSKEAFIAYAEEYAKMPVALGGALCEIQVVFLPEHCGILVKCHHIIGDAWTLTLIASQLCALLAGEEPPAFPYSDYLENEPNYVHSDRRAKDKSFFLEKFKSCPEAVYLSEKPGDSYVAKRSTFHVGVDRTAFICAYAKEHNTSPFMLFLTTFAIYFSRVKDNAGNFYIGTPVLNRGTFREKHTMGMFINTVPVLAQVDYGKSFAKHLAMMQGETLSVLRHQKFHYNDILAAIRKEYGFTEKLYDVVLSYQNAAVSGAGAGIETTWYHSGVQVESLQIHIDDRDGAGDFRIHLDYRIDKFTSFEIERMYNHILNILLDAISDDARKPGELKLLSDEEKKQLLQDFNNTAADYPRDRCVHTLFEEQAAGTPEQTAVIACDRALTYGELNREANRIAHGLIGRGVRPGDTVAFALPRDSHLIPVMFGILKAGAAYLPIDPDYPQERVSFMLEDSGARLFVTERELPGLLAGGDSRNPDLSLSSDSLCYCIYTSGSTGKPKGVTITHCNSVNFCCNHAAFHQAMQACSDCVLATNNIVFDITMQELHLPLLHGKQVFLIKGDVMITKEEANRLDKSCDNLALITTPTRISLLLDDDALAPVFKKCRVIMVGAEKFTTALYRKIRELTDAKVFNGYGPTETTCGCCYQEVVSEDITIGRPIANTQIYILDQYMNPVPIGVTGELCVAGDGVGAGYLNRPELTAEKFVKNPFGEGTLYKTGDLAYWREDGNIVYVGRNDFQVKIRGLRVEPGEIESVMSSVEGVGQAVAAVRKDETGRQLICAFYTGSDAVGTDAIKSAVREKLPRYMMPHIFTRLDALPLTPSGKVDRKRLPEVDLTDYQANTEYVPPRGQMEKGIVAIMEQVLGYSPIGREDDFFDLGGDSLKAIEFVSKAHTEGIYCTIQNIFDYPTTGALREYMESGDKSVVSYQDTDFTSVNRALAENRAEIHRVPDKIEIENLLLTGATGFLGIHILADYLENDRGTVYCLVRGQNQADSERRLEELLDFYFGKKYSRLIGSRIQVLCGDLQKEHFGLSEPDYKTLLEKTDTVINAAATVKHYGSYKFFHEVNVGSVEWLIHFCRQGQAKLIHVSTLSVSGNGFDTFDGYVSPEEKYFYEDSLYIGQPFHNVYARSKFEAEKMLLEAVADGLHASIMRMGNLTNRASDGVFQINHETNAAVQRIKAVLELGVVPDYLIDEDMYVEFTPIDEAARAIVLLAQHFDPERTVFHINSTKVVYLNKLTELFTDLGYPVRAVPGGKFVEALRRTAKQSGMEHIFETFIDDLDKDDRLNYDSNIHIENSFTEEYLRKLGFTWGEIGVEYLKKYVDYFERIGYWRKG